MHRLCLTKSSNHERVDVKWKAARTQFGHDDEGTQVLDCAVGESTNRQHGQHDSRLLVCAPCCAVHDDTCIYAIV